MVYLDEFFLGGMELERKCPNCGKELPEEASFCLFCFVDINNYKKSEVCPVVDETTESKIKKTPILAILKAKFNKRIFCRIGIAAAFLLIMGICIFAMKSMNSGANLKPGNDTTIIKETSTVAVTDKGGEAVTDEAGEQVFEVVEVTKITPVSTTEKQGFFDKIFGSSTTEKETGKGSAEKTSEKSDSTETTKKQSFFDKLFGDMEEEKTTENSSTTQKNDFSTEEHGTTQAPSTSEESTTTPTTTKPSTTKPTRTETQTSEVYTTENGSYYFEYKASDSRYPEGNIALTKYIGDATVVTIPSYIDGIKVVELAENCFKDDPKIKEIILDDKLTQLFSFSYRCFNNLTSLTRVVSNNRSIHIRPNFAYNCPLVYLGKGGENDNKIIDGAIYYGTAFLWFTSHPSYTTLTLPDWCTKIDNGHNLDEVSNLQVLNIHKNIKNIPTGTTHWGTGLKAINVEEGNSEAFSHEGVLFYIWGADTIYSSIYPLNKTDKTFKVPSNSYLCIGGSSGRLTNAYLEEVWLSSTSYIKAPDAKYFYETCYPNLKRIYIAENHPQYNDIAKTFKGELIVKDF